MNIRFYLLNLVDINKKLNELKKFILDTNSQYYCNVFLRPNKLIKNFSMHFLNLKYFKVQLIGTAAVAQLIFIYFVSLLCRIILINSFHLFPELESIIFIHACNNDIEKAKQCSETYYTVRSHCPEFFAKRDVFGEDIKARMKVS